jgi:hypothetical protein
VFVSRWTGAVAHRAADAAFDKSTAAGAAAGAGSIDAQSFPAGPHGGVLKRGHVTHNGERGLVCVWADKLTFGGVTYIFGRHQILATQHRKPTKSGPLSGRELAQPPTPARTQTGAPAAQTGTGYGKRSPSK